MKTVRFSVYREYAIACKQFLPTDGAVNHVILGVHGFAGDKESSMLEKLAKACEDVGTALVSFDFPAHGQSPVGEDMLRIENCKEDLLFVAAHVRAAYPDAKKSIFATSFGGYVALLCAEQLSDFRFVLRAPAVTMPHLLTETVLKIPKEDFRRKGVVRCGFERIIQLPFAFYEGLLREENPVSKRYAQPMLILHGDRDDIVPLPIIQDFAKKHDSVELQIIQGADHRFKNAGEPETVIKAAQRFFGIS